MKIWVLRQPPYGALSEEGSYPITRILEEAKSANLELEFVKEEDFEILLSPDETLFHKGEKVELPDVFWARTGASTNYFQLTLLRYFEHQGVFIINNAHSIEIAKDKLSSLQEMARNNLPIPKTMLGRFPICIETIEKNFSYPFVMKKNTGSRGRGVYLIKDQDHFEEVQELLSESDKKFNFIFQEFVKASHGRDLRVYVVGGRAIGAMLRSANKGFRANVSKGASVDNFLLTPEVEWLAVESAKVLGLEIAGVDLLFEEDGYKICEVNSNPGFEGFEKATNINIPQEIFRFISVRLGS